MIVQDILTNTYVHRFLVKPFIKKGILKTRYGFIDLTGQHPFIQSLIFWNVYERKEIAAIKKYLDKDLDIIELGSSIGLVSMAIGQLLKSKPNKYVSVEANPLLIEKLRHSAELNEYNIKFIHAAVCYNADKVSFDIDDRNLGSKIADGNSKNTVVVNSITLASLFKENHIQHYALVCDIEGAESHIFSDESDPMVIEHCRQIIIELHDTTYKGVHYTTEKLANLIMEKFSMRMLFSADNIWFFEK